MFKQIKMILGQLTTAINHLLYFALLAGFSVLFSAIYSTLDQRIVDGALMRTLGANRQLRRAHLVEFSMIGRMSGFIAVFMYQLILFALYNYVLHLDFHFNILLSLVVPLLSAICVMLAGLWGVRSAVNKPPMLVLRDH